MNTADLPTPAVVIDAAILRNNITHMATLRPATALRPHVKAHKCTSLARLQQDAGHTAFTCATPREVIGMASAGVGADLLLANEVLDPQRLAQMARAQDTTRVTVAVDSQDTVRAAARAGIANVLIDINVGLPRCGCSVDDAPRLADLARSLGIEVRGVMGYEGHLMMIADKQERRDKVHEAMQILADASLRVGGDIVSAGGTGTFDMYDGTVVNEVQTGSYALMDTYYSQLGLPFHQAMWVLGTVISVSPEWAVVDVGLKALGMDHGDPSIDQHKVWFCSDEHITFSPSDRVSFPSIGDQIRVTPGHIDPTMSMHSTAFVIDGDAVIDQWPIDLRGW